MTNPYEPPRSAPVPPSVSAGERDANWALALGIGSLIFCAPLLAPFAIWKALRSNRTVSSAKATVGIVLGAIGLATSVLFWFLAIWQFLTPAERHPAPPRTPVMEAAPSPSS